MDPTAANSESSSSDRLAPRTSGRRFRRQQAGMDGEKLRELESDFRRRPSEDVETQIVAAINARKKQANLALTDEEAPGETEILGNYEYLDHTADIQLHSWGASFEDALMMQVIAMFGYMTKLSLVQVDEQVSKDHATDIQAHGHDLQSLVFAFLQEWLTVFHECGFIVRELYNVRFNRQQWTIKSSARGEAFNSAKHTQGTEVKAVTYSNLSVTETEERCDIWVIVDI
ncbi:protein archease [Mayamaea pseudoterrestris]|nr:protein archease [Mayamaea pseudoterrestris]